tara:strand:- start:332 stop:859 length:528 start_codon:yes stop_codon:yes gene_type:complete
MEQKKKDGKPIPSYNLELGTRIASVIKRFDSLKAAAVHAGVTDETLAAWRDGKTEPKFIGLKQLAEAAQVNLNWLAFGKGFPPSSNNPDYHHDPDHQTREALEFVEPGTPQPLDQDLLMMIIEELEIYRSQCNLEWDSKQKSRLITLGYAMMLAEREKGNRVEPKLLRYLMQAAS